MTLSRLTVGLVALLVIINASDLLRFFLTLVSLALLIIDQAFLY